MYKLKKILDFVAKTVNDCFCEGYAKEQTMHRNRVWRTVESALRRKFPEIADHFTIEEYRGLGYYSCYSDFSVGYDGVQMIGVGSHTSTIHRAWYRAEYDVWMPMFRENPEEAGELEIDEAARLITEYQRDMDTTRLMQEILSDIERGYEKMRKHDEKYGDTQTPKIEPVLDMFRTWAEG